MPSFSRSLEQALHRALALAGERRHEYATLEHLLLALVDDQDAAAVMRACNVEIDTLQAQPRRVRRHRALQPHRRRAAGRQADGRLPARDPARGDPRPVLRPRGGDRRQRAGGDLRRAREPRRLFPAGAGHDPLRRGQLHQPRHRQAPRRLRSRSPSRGAEEEGATERPSDDGDRGARRRRRATRSTPTASTSTRRRATARSTR